MPTRLYRFHCVGPGGDATFDLRGRRLPTLAQVRAHADRVALALMEAGDADWTRWFVDVHDGAGRRILVRPFSQARHRPEIGRDNPDQDLAPRRERARATIAVRWQPFEK